ncbi:hypothetical protein V7150_10165 [Neobacillus drentensis]|uniref:hypothetical protein n=1 Tax=Neobacillus drentensis TaxID=220684 RepID=UPI002FFE02BF
MVFKEGGCLLFLVGTMAELCRNKTIRERYPINRVIGARFEEKSKRKVSNRDIATKKSTYPNVV